MKSTTEEAQGGVGGVRVVGVGELWVDVEWDRAVGAASGQEPVWYEVRNSLGCTNE